jgi:hypothetical protein
VVMKTILVVLALSTASLAQNSYMDDSQLPNGRFWRDMPHIAKMMYLTGVEHGLRIALVRASLDGKCPENLGLIADQPLAR